MQEFLKDEVSRDLQCKMLKSFIVVSSSVASIFFITVVRAVENQHGAAVIIWVAGTLRNLKFQ